jgi:hypothetical protein
MMLQAKSFTVCDRDSLRLYHICTRQLAFGHANINLQIQPLSGNYSALDEAVAAHPPLAVTFDELPAMRIAIPLMVTTPFAASDFGGHLRQSGFFGCCLIN